MEFEAQTIEYSNHEIVSMLLSLLVTSLVSAGAAEWHLPESGPMPTAIRLSRMAKPLWRAGRVWPADILDSASSQPMPWRGESWRPMENEHGGQPTIRKTGEDLQLSARSEWSEQLGAKIAALVFIAPKDGTSWLQGEARARICDGEAKWSDLKVLKRIGGSMDQTGAVELPKAIAQQGVDLKKGEELILVVETRDRSAVIELGASDTKPAE